MPNFVKISRQMTKLSIQALNSDCSVCITVICHCGLLSAAQMMNKSSLREGVNASMSTHAAHQPPLDVLDRLCNTYPFILLRLTFEFKLHETLYYAKAPRRSCDEFFMSRAQVTISATKRQS